MNLQKSPAAAYRTDLAEVIAEFRRLAPTLTFEDEGEEVLTVVCDSLKPEEFAQANELPAWLALKKKIGSCFADWIHRGREWRPLARLVVEETSLLYSADSDFLRVVTLSAHSLPAEVATYMIAVAEKVRYRRS